MTDYIKRTDAVKIAEKYGLANGSVLGRHTGLADCIASEISGLPAADVAEVHHARWEEADWRETKEPCECGGKYTASAFLDDRVRSSCDKEANNA